MSTLEELYNRRGLNPDSIPQLIKELQQERNTYRDALVAADAKIERLHAIAAEMGAGMKMAVDELKRIRNMTEEAER